VRAQAGLLDADAICCIIAKKGNLGWGCEKYVILYELSRFRKGEVESEIRTKSAGEATEITDPIEGEKHGKSHHFRHYFTRW
jgi:hypothetical protein